MEGARRDGTRTARQASALRMQPIHELLSQIRWDPNFVGEIEVAFVERMQPQLGRVPVNQNGALIWSRDAE